MRPTGRRAREAGAAAQTVGQAFLGGYRAALTALTQDERPGALCVTEEGPPHPRAIACTWAGGRLTGTKRYVTGASTAEVLYVAARAGQDGDRAQLVVVAVDPSATGVTLEVQPPTPFVPDVDHAVVTFASAPTGDPMPGDGWADVVKPFRTVEDVHVLTALAAWMAVRTGDREAREDLEAALAALDALSRVDPSDPVGHLALAGVLRAVGPALERGGEALDAGARAGWLRDRALLRVAGSAREARRQAAWERLQ